MLGNKSKLDAAIQTFKTKADEVIASGAFPGVAVAWIVDGETVHTAGYGMADAERKIPMTAETKFRAASISKLFNAIAAMQLVEKGKLSLDAPIEKSVAGFSILNPFEGSDPITLRMLLSHRSGLVREAPVGGYFDAGYSSNSECLESIASCVLANPPGTKACYSNVGPTVAGRALEIQTGMAFDEYQQKNILDPLGMNNSGWILTDEVRKKLAVGLMRYNRGDGTFGLCEAPSFELGTTPAGSLVTTAGDLAKFAAFVMSGTAGANQSAPSQLTPPLIHPETLNEMFKVQFTGAAEGFGLGFIKRNYRGNQVARHGGQLYGFCSLFSVIPEKKIGVVILSNGDEIIGPVRKLTDIALDLLLEAIHDEPLPIPQQELNPSYKELNDFAGEYESPSHWATIKVFGDEKEHKLTANFSTQNISLTAVEPLKFLADGRIMHREPFTFERDADGKITGFTALEQKFKRLDVSKIKQPPLAWEKYVGSYGPEYIPLVVSIRNGRLYACVENEYDYHLRPLNRVTFHLTPGIYTDEQLVFQIDEKGKPYAVILAGMYLKRNESSPQQIGVKTV